MCLGQPPGRAPRARRRRPPSDRPRGEGEGPLERLSPDRLDALLEVARNVRVLVVGDLMLDRYVVGTVERTSPEAPVPVVRVHRETASVGGAANVAANVTALGAACEVVGLVGRDAEGRHVRAALGELGAGVDGVLTDPGRPTTVKTRVVARHRQVVRFDSEVEDDAGPETAAALADAVERLAPACDVIVTQDYDKGALVAPVIGAALEAADRGGLPAVCDPKLRRFFEYRGATVFKPNARELATALGERVRADDAGWMDSVRRRLGCVNLLLTLGEGGLSLHTGEGLLVRVPTAARDVYDVSGAGDTVAGALAVALAAGASVAEAALLANHAAAIEVGKAGVATVSADELSGHARTLHEELAG